MSLAVAVDFDHFEEGWKLSLKKNNTISKNIKKNVSRWERKADI